MGCICSLLCTTAAQWGACCLHTAVYVLQRAPEASDREQSGGMQMRSTRNFCVDIVLLCIVMAIALYIYDMVSTKKSASTG